MFPVLAIAQELMHRQPTSRIVFIGKAGGTERELVEQFRIVRPGAGRTNEEAIEFIGIQSEKLRRYWSWRIFVLPFALSTGVVQAFGHLYRLKPAAVLCKGGSVGVPVALAAWTLRIPVILHETDAAMGLANRLAAPFAAKVAVTFPRPKFPSRYKKKAVFTGQPVREEFFRRHHKKKSPRPYLMITAGSQGSVAINSLILQILPELLERYHVIHITGQRDYGRMRAASQDKHYEPIAFTGQHRKLLGIADLVISRAGGTIFELAALGKPTILIPLPTAANDHQRINAEIFAEHEATVVLEQTTLTAETLLKTVTSLMRDSKRRSTLAANIRRFAHKDAAARVAHLILEVARIEQ